MQIGLFTRFVWLVGKKKRWGAINQVCFDPGKDSLHILDGRRPCGDSFRLLGVTFDTQLTMKYGIMEIAARGHARVQMVLRARRSHSERETFQLFKAHVLPFLGHATTAIHHAVPFHLAVLDRMRESFLEAIGVSAGDALVKHRLAPLRTRWDKSLLVFLTRLPRPSLVWRGECSLPSSVFAFPRPSNA